MDIFFFSLIALPLLIPRKQDGVSTITKIANRWGNPWMLLFFFLFMGLASIITDVAGLGMTEQMGSWDVLSYFVFFLYGYFIFSNERYLKAINKYGILLLIVAAILSAAHLVFVFVPSLREIYDTFPFNLRGFCAWSWILGLLGIGSRWLNNSSNFLGYANEAVLPFYILHQPIILIIGFFVIPWNIGIAPKYLIIATTSFIAILAIYDILVRRIKALRFLFGLRLR
jgi:hypothetical protein